MQTERAASLPLTSITAQSTWTKRRAKLSVPRSFHRGKLIRTDAVGRRCLVLPRLALQLATPRTTKPSAAVSSRQSSTPLPNAAAAVTDRSPTLLTPVFHHHGKQSRPPSAAPGSRRSFVRSFPEGLASRHRQRRPRHSTLTTAG